MNTLILIILSGVLIALSFPGYFIPFSGFFGFFIFFKEIYRYNLRKTTIFSFSVGFIFSILTLYWTVYAITYYGGVSILLGIPLLLILASVFSIFQFVSTGLLFFILKKRYREYAFLIIPFIWVFLEFLREFFPFGGFPWNLTGYTLSYFNSIAQITSVFSIYFLSFIAVFIPSALVFLYKKEKFSFVSGLIATFIFLLTLHIWGIKRAENIQIKGVEKRVAVIQGNISEDVKLMNEEPLKVIDNYVDLIKKAYREKPDLIVLPESALPFFYINGDDEKKNYFLEKVKNIHIPIILGSDIAFIDEKENIKIFNGMLLLDENKSVVSLYKKIKLVPFGEYVPFPFKIFQGIFPYLSGYDFSPGEEKSLLKYKQWRIVPLICFEAIFPDFVSSFVKDGNVIINISNDAWFGKTVAPFQHFEMARVRAIETGLFLIRATNTGISAIINPEGVIEKKLGLFKRGYIIGEVYLGRSDTVWIKYHRFIWLIFLFSSLGIIIYSEYKKESGDGERNKRRN